MIVCLWQLVTLRDELFRHGLSLPDARFNVDGDVIDAAFAALLMYLDEVLPATRNSSPSQVHVARFLYELERGVAAMNACLGSSVSVANCCEWGEHKKARQRTANHAQVW
ncbi:hypothetical protein PC116_g13166 [Phytophthora cactorum]|uniref:Uncharacterized protein n=1 Tax=Phytophthora cactorum TaxID=29920 RepID=A0A329SCK1_9STRA|nr:hypothetical protein Pcac1_g22049 [Phytophthora cactorum]KAG2877518.1 hypothetical protein PC114_g23581 [Phytophthora cactorum]KAG2908260.1 hypothetical protein PC117_g20001 [Phytophthora cactorum]KAG2987096.1 hypothetical protein PC119_g19768 [Phytophthora cactorum]KAG3147042.1 hypothetical protein PC128_g23881 [Phytophthora cactorum]